jgi:uncharacterized protein
MFGFFDHRASGGKDFYREAGTIQVMANEKRDVRIVFHNKDAGFHTGIVAGGGNIVPMSLDEGGVRSGNRPTLWRPPAGEKVRIECLSFSVQSTVGARSTMENPDEKRTMNIVLSSVEARVLGSLTEKDITTPDYYPLSLNALVNACNQKNNRDPVMNLDEGAVREALDSLQQKRLTGPTSSADSRVTKYEHRFQEVFNFTRGETAVLCVLLLRGAQTPGELRGRTERLHRFEDLTDVQSTLQRLIQRDPPLATVLSRQPGTKESRYMHLLSGEVEGAAGVAELAAFGEPTEHDRLSLLEAEVVTLRNEIEDLKMQLASFRKQFE